MTARQNTAQNIQPAEADELLIGEMLVSLRDERLAYSAQDENRKEDSPHEHHVLTAKEIWMCNRATD